ncbi:MAG TPA: hypothetical protein DGG95_15225 [Cytophagales bacterium]|nr:hypothetical protein [Cytophagales bacterium]
MKVIFTIAVVFFWAACTDQTQNLNSPGTNAGAKGSTKSTSNFGDYNVGLSVSTDGTLYTYTITKNSGAKDLSHFIINLQNCGDQSATFNDILWATLNGQSVNWVDTEGQGTGCDPQSITSNFVKFENLGSTSTYVIVVKFDRGYSQTTTTGWLKAGTSCNSGAVPGPGCPIVEKYCSMSQGYYFSNGSKNNGSDSVWTAAGGVTVGLFNYTHAEGMAIWTTNTGKGNNAVIRAFFQYAAIILSGTDYSSDPALAAAMATIQTYYSNPSLPKVTSTNCVSTKTFTTPFNDPTGAVQNAGGVIGDWVDKHECPTN